MEKQKRTNQPPKGVVRGVLLLGTALLLSMIRGVTDLDSAGLGEAYMPLLIGGFLLFLLFSLFLLWKIYRGREWARITHLGLFTFSLISSMGETVTWFDSAPSFFWLYVMETLLVIGGFVLLFQRKSSQWFMK
ncbi:hypothetical protein JF544_01750 [Halobacillus kuroshimensis]|uniref:Uncharacterized protein n=1 Tax=Halobacillus kuroshimensis TaxID=302481 RepID=A0ABS3DRI4_9BACI|nr:hypothetical protein [Halobacillus kuroshimensis]MBN8233944.1 hypothetical protein [Halobacillus kuroshimensis]